MKKILISSLILLFFQIQLGAQQLTWEESVFVHISKNIAVTEEPIWIAIEVASTEESFSPSMAYVELVNRSGQSVHQLLIPLQNGKGTNIIRAPSNLISDHYILRCYTRSSPYTGQNGIFNQLITIINPEKPAPIIKNPSSLMEEFVSDHKYNTNLILMSTITKDSSSYLQIPNDGIVSVSLANPFLDKKQQKRLSNKIYKPLDISKILPEPFGHVVHARLRAEHTDQAYYLSAHGKQNYFNISKPNSNGEMFFELASFRDVNFLLAQKEDESSAMDFELISPFLGLQLVDNLDLPALEIEKKDEDFLNKLMLAARVEGYYYKPQSSESTLINTEIKPDKTYILDDYNRFENIEITLKEYVSEVYVRKMNKNVLFKVMNAQTGMVFNKNPLLLIDNMPIMNPDDLAAFDPKAIEKIDLITRSFYFNDQAYDGVISLTSKSGDFGGFELSNKALYLDYYTFAKKIELKNVNVNPNRENKNFPDFRNLLYWNDQTQKGAQAIYPSQLSGSYIIKHSYFDGQSWHTQLARVEIKN